MALKILATFLIWILTYPLLILTSAFVVAYKLQTAWDGKDSLFGNRKYGRLGNKASPCTNNWQAWVFLVIRNPISNFGKETLSVSSNATWPWHYDVKLVGKLWVKAGWKEVKDPSTNPERTFVFRPHWGEYGLD